MSIQSAGKAFLLIDYTTDILDDIDKKIQTGLKAAGAAAVSHATVPVSRGGDMPVDTGRLMNSITYATAEFHSNGKNPAQGGDYAIKGIPGKREVYIGTNVEYAEAQEKKHHYLKNAAANHSAEYEKIMRAALK